MLSPRCKMVGLLHSNLASLLLRGQCSTVMLKHPDEIQGFPDQSLDGCPPVRVCSWVNEARGRFQVRNSKHSRALRLPSSVNHAFANLNNHPSRCTIKPSSPSPHFWDWEAGFLEVGSSWIFASSVLLGPQKFVSGLRVNFFSLERSKGYTVISLYLDSHLHGHSTERDFRHISHCRQAACDEVQQHVTPRPHPCRRPDCGSPGKLDQSQNMVSYLHRATGAASRPDRRPPGRADPTVKDRCIRVGLISSCSQISLRISTLHMRHQRFPGR